MRRIWQGSVCSAEHHFFTEITSNTIVALCISYTLSLCTLVNSHTRWLVHWRNIEAKRGKGIHETIQTRA